MRRHWSALNERTNSCHNFISSQKKKKNLFACCHSFPSQPIPRFGTVAVLAPLLYTSWDEAHPLSRLRNVLETRRVCVPTSRSLQSNNLQWPHIIQVIIDDQLHVIILYSNSPVVYYSSDIYWMSLTGQCSVSHAVWLQDRVNHVTDWVLWWTV